MHYDDGDHTHQPREHTAQPKDSTHVHKSNMARTCKASALLYVLATYIVDFTIREIANQVILMKMITEKGLYLTLIANSCHSVF